MMNGKKIIVIGCPGSGKSVFSRELSNVTGLPLHHLDMMYWLPDKTTVPTEEFERRLRLVMQGDEWIIDGNYNRTMEWRMCECDTVFFLDYPRGVCIDGIMSRMGKRRDDIPWVETEHDADFLKFVTEFDAESKPKILALFEKYPEKEVIVFHSRDEADAYLGAIKSC